MSCDLLVWLNKGLKDEASIERERERDRDLPTLFFLFPCIFFWNMKWGVVLEITPSPNVHIIHHPVWVPPVQWITTTHTLTWSCYSRGEGQESIPPCWGGDTGSTPVQGIFEFFPWWCNGIAFCFFLLLIFSLSMIFLLWRNHCWNWFRDCCCFFGLWSLKGEWFVAFFSAFCFQHCNCWERSENTFVALIVLPVMLVLQ